MSVTHQKAQEIFESHPTRFNRKEKEALRGTLRAAFVKMGYTDDQITEINASGTNLLVGDPHAEYMFTAHYDTPGKTGWMLHSSWLWGQAGANIFLMIIMIALCVGIPLVNTLLMDHLSSDTAFILGELGLLAMLLVMVISMVFKNKNNRNDNTSGVLALLAMAEKVAADEEMKKKCCFVFFDNEEWGLLGSGGYAKHCKKNGIDLSGTKVINFDCVGHGDVLTFASTKNTGIVNSLVKAFDEAGQNPVKKRSMMIFLSDHANFNNSVMVSYTKHSALGLLYLPLIHTSKDIPCDIDQINRLTGDIFEFARQGKI